MNLPTQYSYNPRLWLVALTLGAGFAWLTLMGFECGCWPHGFSLWSGVLPIMLGLFMTVRRFLFKSYLVLNKEALVVPTGFGRVRTKRVPYTSIERVWETRLPFAIVLSVATKRASSKLFQQCCRTQTVTLILESSCTRRRVNPSPD
jgi:hypothetical protein